MQLELTHFRIKAEHPALQTVDQAFSKHSDPERQAPPSSLLFRRKLGVFNEQAALEGLFQPLEGVAPLPLTLPAKNFQVVNGDLF